VTASTSPQALVVTSSGAPAGAVVSVLAALEAAGMRVRAIDVGGAGGGGSGVTDRLRRALLGESAERRLRRELESNPPDVAVAFDPHAALALTVARDQVSSPAPVVAVVAELDPASEWGQTDADRFVAVDELAAAQLAERGVEGERVIVVGSFGERTWSDAGRQDVASLRQRFKLDGTPVLVDASGLGAEVAGQLMMQLSLAQSADSMVFLFDAAGDPEVAGLLRRQVPVLGLRAKLFGATADAPLLWRAAEVVVARPRPHVLARALLSGRKLVALVDDSADASVRVAAALEVRGRAIMVRSVLLLSGALDAAVKGGSPAVLADGADNTADVVWAVASDKRGVIDERRAAARAQTGQRVQAVAASAQSAARMSAMPGDLEDLGAPGGAPASAPVNIDLDRLHDEVKARIAEMTQSMMAARTASDDLAARAASAGARGDTAAAEEAARGAEVERARMHALLTELATLEAELAQVQRARSAPPTAPPPSATAPPPSRASVDDALADLKKRAGGASAPSRPVGAKPPPGDGTVDDELAKLKKKMSSHPRKKGS
jgi:hypothetical protein